MPTIIAWECVCYDILNWTSYRFHIPLGNSLSETWSTLDSRKRLGLFEDFIEVRFDLKKRTRSRPNLVMARVNKYVYLVNS